MVDALAGLSDARWWAAGSVAIAYLAICIYFLRPRGRRAVVLNGSDTRSASTLVAFASQTGFAAELAKRTAQSLQAAGAPVMLASLRDVNQQILQSIHSALFVVSTTGEGDAPDSAAAFLSSVLDGSLALSNLEYGVLALGDRDYHNYCAFGRRLDQQLRYRGARALFDVVEVDNGDEGALRHWQQQLRALGSNPDLPDWDVAPYQRWRLVARRLLNPGSAGGACFHLELQPLLDDASPTAVWQAGDIAEVDPRNSTWRAGSPALPHREYSIASLPRDGAIHLLVRQIQRAEGEPGLGSGWLTADARIGDAIALRVRQNSNFHAPSDDIPLILVGNGTGMAGLRALLKARIAAGHLRNWLIFGERNRAHDGFYAEELESWRAAGQIHRIDWVFSRDQPARRYVQDCIREQHFDIRDWVDSGAAVYVCGSLHGMAPAVATALGEALGAERFAKLTAAGKYRRDVY